MNTQQPIKSKEPYEPFGDQWFLEMKKWNKTLLIDFLRTTLIELKDSKEAASKQVGEAEIGFSFAELKHAVLLTNQEERKELIGILSISKQVGNVWVKASKRFMPKPVRNNTMRVRFSAYGTHSIDGTKIKTWDDKAIFMLDGTDYILTNIEWLDESAPLLAEENRRLREVLKAIREYCGSRAGYNMTVIYNMTIEILNETYHPVSDAGNKK